MRPLGGLPPTWGSPRLPPAPMPIPPGKGASSTPRRERIGGAGADTPPTADGLLLCSVALSVAFSAHRRAAGSCARDSRLTHHPPRPSPPHCIRRREHAALSMLPVRGGELVSALARARRGVSGGADIGRGAPAAGSTPSGRRDGAAREQGLLVVAVVRAGRGWGCGLLGGTGAARLTTRADGQPARPARAVHAPRQSRPRGAGVAVEAAGVASPRRCARHRVAALAVPAMQVRAPGHR